MNEIIAGLKDRITLNTIPFTERGSRIMVLRRGHTLEVQLAESWSEDDAPTLIYIDLLDATGQPLDANVTTLPHRVDMHTSSGEFALCFADTETLLFSLPTGCCGIRLRTKDGQPHPDRRGGSIHVPGPIALRMTYTTNAAITRQAVESSDGHSTITLMVDAGSLSNGFLLNITRAAAINRYIPVFDDTVQAAETRWSSWFDVLPTVPEAYRPHYYFAWWVLGVNLIRLYFHPQREGLIPSKRGYVGVWNWDSYFHVIALRHRSTELARSQIRILLDHQLPNGMIPDVIQDQGALTHTTDYGIDADITKPPLTAWAVWKIFEMDGDTAFLDEVYDALVRAQRWWFAEHDSDHNGLCEYAHPYSSGLDNNPLFDDKRVPLETPDLNAYLILQYDHLAKIARVLGRDNEAHEWTQAAAALTQRLLDLRWDETAGYFWAHYHDQPVPVRTPFSLFPLITGRMPPAIAQRLVQHLTDEAQFWSRFPVPTVALNDAHHNPGVMWRGPVWINVNYLLIDGLKRAGFPEVARELRRKTIDMMLSQPDIYEYYNPNTGEKPPRAVSAFGWSAALLIDLMLDEKRTD